MRHISRFEVVARDDTDTAVPTKDRVILSSRTHGFSGLKTVHCLPEQLVSSDTAFCEFGFGPTLIHNAGVVGAFIITLDPCDVFRDAGIADGIVLAKSVAHREDDISQGFLIFRVDR